jgi:hypothetical protein
MLDLQPLRVSLTKNGYLKIAEVVKRHPRWEVLDNIRGAYRGVNLVRSQVANIMGEDISGELPEFWDEIRQHGDRAVDAFVLVAIIMSHGDLIHLLKASFQGDMKGHLERASVGEKAYTNLVYAMACCGLCDYARGAEATTYDMRGLVHELREAGHVVRQLIEHKMRRCGWRPADRPGGTDFFRECEENEIHRVFGLEPRAFRSWLENRLRIAAPAERQHRPRLPR